MSAAPAPRSAIYCRCSTDRQDLEGQLRELEQEAARRGLTVTARYLEKVSATGRVDRAEYDRLLRDAASPDRRWDHLLVWALDRFSREETFTRATQAVLDLEKSGVRFHSLKEPTIDTPEDGTPNLGRDVLLALLPVVASFESKRRSERTRLAMAEIKAGRRRTRTGRPPGRPRRVQPEHLRRIAELRETLKPNGLRRKWSEIALSVQLPAETCRKAYAALRVGTPRREKGQDGFLPLGGAP